MLTSLRREGQAQSASLFLYLPAELRNQIYEYVFQGWVIVALPSIQRHDSLEADIYPASADPYQTMRARATHRPSRPLNLLGLLCTCRQIHSETRLLPYRLNSFLCGERPFPSAWLNNLQDRLAHVRSLQLRSYMFANITLPRIWLETLRWFISIEKVEVFYHLLVPPWGQEEDHLATATADEAEMKQKIVRATSATCDVVFHRFILSDWD